MEARKGIKLWLWIIEGKTLRYYSHLPVGIPLSFVDLNWDSLPILSL